MTEGFNKEITGNEKHTYDHMDNDKLNEKLKKEQDKLNTFKQKRAVLDDKIKECESNIERLTLIKNSQKYKSFSESIQKNGLTVEDIISALQSGDFLSLQEKIESNTEKSESTETEPQQI